MTLEIPLWALMLMILIVIAGIGATAWWAGRFADRRYRLGWRHGVDNTWQIAKERIEFERVSAQTRAQLQADLDRKHRERTDAPTWADVTDFEREFFSSDDDKD